MRKIFSLIAAVLFAGSMMADNFVLVTDASTLAAGDQIIITDVDAAAAISTLQKSNNRGVTTVALTDGVIVPGENVQIITLVAAEANFMLQVGEDAYLYAASNSSNYLKTANAETVGDNGKFAISIASGVASVTAQGTNSRNDLRYNPSSSCFSCYGSNSSIEAGLKIFKKEGGVTPTPVVEYYVVGSMNNWALDAAYKLAANPAVSGEFMKRFTFAANDELKVRKAIDGELDAWYPEGMGNNWVITADGDYDVYFRPEGNTEWANGYFYVAPYVAPAIPQYEVATAIAAGLTDGTEIEVRGVITKMEAKGKNFAQYGSVNVYVADATGAEGEFEFYNCYSMQADTFKTTVPAYDATSTAWTQFTEVADAKGYTLHVGDTVVAHGNYKLYNSTHELNTGCYVVYAKVPGAEYPTNLENAATEQKTIKFFENGQLFINKNGVIYNAQGTIVR